MVISFPQPTISLYPVVYSVPARTALFFIPGDSRECVRQKAQEILRENNSDVRKNKYVDKEKTTATRSTAKKCVW